MKTALIVVGEIRSLSLHLSNLLNLIAINNADVFMVLTNYNQQQFDKSKVPNLKFYKEFNNKELHNEVIKEAPDDLIQKYYNYVKKTTNNEYLKSTRIIKIYNDIFRNNYSMSRNLFVQIFLYNYAIKQVSNNYDYVIKLRPDLSFDNIISIEDLYCQSYEKYVNTVRSYKKIFPEITNICDILFYYIIFKSNFNQLSIYLIEFNELFGNHNNVTETILHTNTSKIVKFNDDYITHKLLGTGGSPIFMGWMYNPNCHIVINKLIQQLKKIIEKYNILNIIDVCEKKVFDDLLNISNNIVYMYHDFIFVSTYETATKYYIRTANDYFNPKYCSDVPYGCFIENIIHTKLMNSEKIPLYMKQNIVINRTIL
jgi:hypothetical protein